MSHPVKGVDHVFILVNDLDAAAADYAALGFTLSPRGLHSAAKGTANYTIMFPDDYFELLGIIKNTELNASRRAKLEACGQGLHAIACRIDSAEEAAQALGALGLATKDLGSFSRPVPLPGGGEGVAAFSTVSFTPENTPFGTVFMCQHKTRDTVWIPELLEHPNTACGLGAIFGISEDPAADAARFAKLWAAGKVSAIEDGARIETGVAGGSPSAPLILLTPAAMQAAYPGADLSETPRGAFAALRVKVADPAAARACAEKAGVAPIETASGFAVPLNKGAGALVEFVPA